MGHTIFDDVFRTMMEKFPEMVVWVINEVFGTNYDESDVVIQKKNEHQNDEGRIITDSMVQIKGKTYHIECQSTEDGEMIIRMIEYDFAIALEELREVLVQDEKSASKPLVIKFPHSCVLALRHTKNTPSTLKMFIEMPNKHRVDYEVPIVKVQAYTKEEIFQKNLLMFLPFYIMRYEKDIKKKKNDILDSLVEEYASIRLELDKIALENERSQRYDQLIELIIKISDYIGAENEEYLERMGTVMGGQVLELEVDKAWDRAWDKAWTEATDIATSKQMIDDVKKIASKLNKSEAEACTILDIPIEKYNNAKITIAKFDTGKKD